MTQETRTLEQIRMAEPCGVMWDRMDGDERVRFCGECRKNVYNLSAMSRAEAEALVFETEGRVCVRFYKRRDGTVLTDNCPVGLRKARRWLSLQLAAISAAFAGVIALAPWASGDRLKKTDWYQRARQSSVANQEPLRTLFERLDPTPPIEVYPGMMIMPLPTSPTPPVSPGGG
jgi:hypothetical protein